ncbi:nucleotidyltransferase domain-containing protein [Hymenobacter seoulensis]
MHDALYTRIQIALQEVEDTHGVRVLYACESGSRAWGFPSPDSDYDVRFIYCHPTSWYLTLEEGPDTLNFPVDELLDLGGWELRKALKLLRSSNASLFEWLQSPIVYQEALDFRALLQPLLPRTFNLRAGLHHYLGLVRRGLEADFTTPEVRIKRLFYALRSGLSARWIRERQTVPPMQFAELLAVLPPSLHAEVTQLLIEKAQAAEKATVLLSPTLLSFLQEEYAACQQARDTLPVLAGSDPVADLNQLFQYWLAAAFPA